MASLEMKLRSVPDMGYFVNENSGTHQLEKYEQLEDQLILE